MKNQKLLSPGAVFLLGINSIIGSGIFLLAGKIYLNAGSLSLLAILLAGLSILVIAFSYATMSRIYPENGGAFIYAKETFGRFAGFIIGMMTWLLGVVTLATEVSALLTAARMLWPRLDVQLIGVAIIVLLGVVSYFGSTVLAGLDNFTSAIKILIVLVFVATCVWLVQLSHFSLTATITLPAGLTRPVTPATGFVTAYGTVFFFFTGFSFLPVNAEKMQNPARNLPRVLTTVMLTCIAAYLVIQAVTIGALGGKLPATAVPAATAFSRVVGPIGVPLIVIAICLSIFGVIVATTFNTPTVLASLAQDHEDVPLIVARKNKYGVPTLALVLTTAGAIALFLSGNYVFLSGLTVFMSFVQYLSTGLSALKERARLIGAGTIVFSLVLLFSFTLPVLALGFGILLVLAMIYLIVKERTRK